jgi:hypothetical protein
MVTGGFVLYFPDTRAELAGELRHRLPAQVFTEAFAAGRAADLN